jgi:hypothetical protein
VTVIFPPAPEEVSTNAAEWLPPPDAEVAEPDWADPSRNEPISKAAETIPIAIGR